MRLSKSPYTNEKESLGKIYKTKNQQKMHKEIIEFLDYLPMWKTLDVGERNPFSDELEHRYNVSIDRTSSDLDFDVIAPSKDYHLIIFSHVIEHLMNPLFTLIELRKLLSEHGKIVLAYPVRFKKGTHHFHEIPFEDMKNLITKAGMEIVKYERHRVAPITLPIEPGTNLEFIMSNFKDRNYKAILTRYLIGIRPIIRIIISFFTDRNYVILLQKGIIK